jgi:hypothetical protein
MLAVFLTVAPFVGRPVAADPVLDFSGGTQGGPPFSTVDATLGWKFTVGVNSTITIEGLGIFDFGANGLAENHQIRLWNNDGTSVLASATIKADGSNSTPVGSASSDGNWRSTPITSLTLTAGDYVVGAFYMGHSSDAFITQATTVSTIPGVTWDEYRGAPGLAFPLTITGEGGKGFFGPNLFTAAAPPVPEPKTYAMLMAGLGLLGLIARRRRKSLNAAA